jgi:hypothetical protein
VFCSVTQEGSTPAAGLRSISHIATSGESSFNDGKMQPHQFVAEYRNLSLLMLLEPCFCGNLKCHEFGVTIKEYLWQMF